MLLSHWPALCNAIFVGMQEIVISKKILIIYITFATFDHLLPSSPFWQPPAIAMRGALRWLMKHQAIWNPICVEPTPSSARCHVVMMLWFKPMVLVVVTVYNRAPKPCNFTNKKRCLPVICSCFFCGFVWQYHGGFVVSTFQVVVEKGWGFFHPDWVMILLDFCPKNHWTLPKKRVLTLIFASGSGMVFAAPNQWRLRSKSADS